MLFSSYSLASTCVDHLSPFLFPPTVTLLSTSLLLLSIFLSFSFYACLPTHFLFIYSTTMFLFQLLSLPTLTARLTSLPSYISLFTFVLFSPTTPFPLSLALSRSLSLSLALSLTVFNSLYLFSLFLSFSNTPSHFLFLFFLNFIYFVSFVIKSHSPPLQFYCTFSFSSFLPNSAYSSLFFLQLLFSFPVIRLLSFFVFFFSFLFSLRLVSFFLDLFRFLSIPLFTCLPKADKITALRVRTVFFFLLPGLLKPL
ncbi:unnamed protein product [Acanthosepion pharaonis]|uniref:Uncharacterized protein n=1 Tax=Acanthosepion pharaonis TaxID=158019 RepID=A0A812APJ9_ACAPH|nr:unnamed protein product [Sepia pharaonis]